MKVNTDKPKWAEKFVASLTETERWQLRHALAGPNGRWYGDGGTIHSTGMLDVETTPQGNVVSVWFRCQMLPWRQTVVTSDRAAYFQNRAGTLPTIHGLELGK